jgi:formimidoylglutamate deiminase
MTIEISASQMLSARGWLHDAKISIDAEGYVVDIAPNDGQCDHSVGVLLPAMGNVHSHSFQRAMAGLAERRGPTAIDDFWTWRQVMYWSFFLLMTSKSSRLKSRWK